MNAGSRPCLLALASALALAGCGKAPEPEATQAPVAPPRATTSAPLPSTDPSDGSSLPADQASAAPDPVDSPAPVAARRYAPQDDCSANPGWPAFRKSLATAIRTRDAEALAALSAPDIALDYGGGSGIAELKKRLADPGSGLWQELAAIMPLGCAIEGGLAAMPWIFWNVPEAADSFNAMLVLGNDTPLRQTPEGKVIMAAGWFLATLDPLVFDPDAKATQVTLENGRIGWVETAKLRSVLDYRLIAEPQNGTWRITAFIAGD